MPTRARKSAAERARLSGRLPQEIAAQARRAKTVSLPDGPDPWLPLDPWLPEVAHPHELEHMDPWSRSGVEEVVAHQDLDPWADCQKIREPQTRKIEVGIAVAAAAASAASQGLSAVASKNATHGCRAARVARVCESACARGCKLPGCQKKGLSTSVALRFVEDYWHLPLEHQAHCMRSAYYSGDLAWSDPEVKWSRVQPARSRSFWSLGSTSLCFARLCQVLGVGQRTVRKMIAGCIDQRRKLPGLPAPAKAAEQFVKCNTFFTELHQSAAVPDPEDCACGMAGPVVQDQVTASPWENWDYDWGGASPITVACQAQVLGIPRRYLSHIRLLDLYWQMTAEWSVLLELRPSVGPMPSFRTFVRCYRSVWKKLLVIRRESQHARCQICSDLQAIMQRSNVPWSERTAAAKQLRQHHRDQYTDRMLYWSMRWSSRQAVQPEVICVIIDSMGKWGSAWPKFHHDKIPHDLERISRPTMILTAALAHGWCTGLYLSLEPYGHGSASSSAWSHVCYPLLFRHVTVHKL